MKEEKEIYTESQAAAIRAIVYRWVYTFCRMEITTFNSDPSVAALRRYALQLQFTLLRNQSVEAVLQAVNNLLTCIKEAALSNEYADLKKLEFPFPIDFTPQLKALPETQGLSSIIKQDFSQAIASYLNQPNSTDLLKLRSDHYNFDETLETEALQALLNHVSKEFQQELEEKRQQAFVSIAPIIAHVVRDWTFALYKDDMDLNYLNFLNEFRAMGNAPKAYTNEAIFTGFLKLIWSCQKPALQKPLIEIANCFVDAFHMKQIAETRKTSDERWEVPLFNCEMKDNENKDGKVLIDQIAHSNEFLQMQLDLMLCEFGKLTSEEALEKLALSQDSADVALLNMILAIQSQAKPEILLHFAHLMQQQNYKGGQYKLLAAKIEGTFNAYHREVKQFKGAETTQTDLKKSIENFKNQYTGQDPKVSLALARLELKLTDGFFATGDCYIALQEFLYCEALQNDLYTAVIVEKNEQNLTELQKGLKALYQIAVPTQDVKNCLPFEQLKSPSSTVSSSNDQSVININTDNFRILPPPVKGKSMINPSMLKESGKFNLKVEKFSDKEDLNQINTNVQPSSQSSKKEELTTSGTQPVKLVMPIENVFLKKLTTNPNIQVILPVKETVKTPLNQVEKQTDREILKQPKKPSPKHKVSIKKGITKETQSIVNKMPPKQTVEENKEVQSQPKKTLMKQVPSKIVGIPIKKIDSSTDLKTDQKKEELPNQPINLIQPTKQPEKTPPVKIIMPPKKVEPVQVVKKEVGNMTKLGGEFLQALNLKKVKQPSKNNPPKKEGGDNEIVKKN